MTSLARRNDPGAGPIVGFVGAVARVLHRRTVLRGYLLLSPALMLMLVAISVPLITMFTMSLWSVSGYDVDTTLSAGNYIKMTQEPIYRVLIFRSLTVATYATVFTIIVCYPMAYYVAFCVKRNKVMWMIIMTLPFWTSYLLRVFAWKVVLGHEGVLNTALMWVGIIDEPISALLYSQTAVTLVLAHSWAAFAILPIYLSLEKIDKSYLEAAADLGDSPARRFWRITFPLSLPGVLAGFFMMFIPTVGDYITPLMVGGPDGMMVGNLIQANFGAMNNWPAGAALSVVMIFAIAMAGLVFFGLSRLIRR
ncbi:spermidine/putrescine ABC transporter permease protein [Octadecabacter antarcticus 307]|uniref:Spermidine/putrescine ABC transporter permease protein n=1 Tax=Octadecabacter antarcticus 307 TaxID=391626 RepID=M9RBX7_9RHOB|nr:ABC transporter permease [Octadecabacter antarcticus]AGI69687.1 spermidine/putrescine ABC transporter permease protein [Octadecabacter antarcticus 307]